MASTVSYRPPNVPELFRLNHVYGFAGTNFALGLWGVSATLFCQCAANHLHAIRRSSPNDDARRRAKVIQLVFVCALFVIGTLNMAGLAWSSAVGTLDYPLYPGGAYVYAMLHFREPMFMLGQIPFAITTWLADGFMLYRCYVVYAMIPQVWYILILPFLAFFASMGTGITIIVLSTAPNSNLFKLVDLTVANAGLTAGLNILLTALISGRLISHSLTMRKAMGDDADSMRMYTSIWTMLVESCAIYSAFSLMFMVTYAVDHPSGKLFLSILGQIQVIAPMLVALRLSREMARPSQEPKNVSNIAGGDHEVRQSTTIPRQYNELWPYTLNLLDRNRSPPEARRDSSPKSEPLSSNERSSRAGIVAGLAVPVGGEREADAWIHVTLRLHRHECGEFKGVELISLVSVHVADLYQIRLFVSPRGSDVERQRPLTA